jgi:hypothetical protein
VHRLRKVTTRHLGVAADTARAAATACALPASPTSASATGGSNQAAVTWGLPPTPASPATSSPRTAARRPRTPSRLPPARRRPRSLAWRRAPTRSRLCQSTTAETVRP